MAADQGPLSSTETELYLSLRDPNVVLDQYVRAGRGITSAAQRDNFEVLLRHTEAEVLTRDIKTVLDTMTNDPELTFFGSPDFPSSIAGGRAVRKFYTEALTSGSDSIGPRLHRLGIADDLAVLELELLFSPDTAMAAFQDRFSTTITARPFLVRKRICVLVLFAQGKIAAAIHYVDGPVGPDDVMFLERPDPMTPRRRSYR